MDNPNFMPKSFSSYIHIKGAKVHNLKNIELKLPKNQLIVITGLSGSGKSSLAFDTLYAEGQRRYVESMSSYARQFLGRLEKPEVEYIKGIAPAIAIEQKVTSRNSRSTVGTSTEIYDYMKLLFARIGKTYSPISGEEVKKETAQDVLHFLKKLKEEDKFMLMAPYTIAEKKQLKKYLTNLKEEGYNRVLIDKIAYRIDDLLDNTPKTWNDFYLILDRNVWKNEEQNIARVSESIQNAFSIGNGYCSIYTIEDDIIHTFSNLFEKDGIVFTQPHEHLFSFNNPIGACRSCQGYGKTIGIDEDLVIPDKNLSVYDEAVVCWKGDKMSEWKDQLVNQSHKFDFPVHKPIYELTSNQQKLLWTGNQYFEGLNSFFQYVEANSYKIQYRIMLSRYRGKTTCKSCDGKRLRQEAEYIKINNHSITDLVDISIEKCADFFEKLTLTSYEESISKRILIEIKSRLTFLINVGLGYLTLNRLSATLSGGESQRINLATSLGSSLVGSMYILDEPSIGLHSKDTERLVSVLKSLRDIGNTVIVVEHDEDIMKEADLIVDMGPMAGSHGGQVVFQGTHQELTKAEKSLTAKYLTGQLEISIPENKREWNKSIQFLGCRENNLNNINATIPLNVFNVISGMSGSGKSTLVKTIIYPALKKIKGGHASKTGDFNKIEGDIDQIFDVEYIDQNPIGKSSRSNPATYVKAYDDIRTIFSNLQSSKVNGFKPKHFSFNTDGGRCDTCKGDGSITINMQFMADVVLKCNECQGKRFKDEVLEIKLEEKSIHDILEMTIEDAITFFTSLSGTYAKKVVEKLIPLNEIGLGYLQLGQPSNTLSGGEAQRIKLGSFLVADAKAQPTLFIFDEPTTGLHFHDINKLLIAFYALIEKGHTLLVIEHNIDVIKCADWLIDMGPEGGERGGNIVFEGKPENLVGVSASQTANFLKNKKIQFC